MVVTASLINEEDLLKVTDHGSDDTVNAVNIRSFFTRTAFVTTTTRTPEATLIQVRQRVPEAKLQEGRSSFYQCRDQTLCRAFVNSAKEASRMHAHADYGRVYLAVRGKNR